jgi:hypothetical protein
MGDFFDSDDVDQIDELFDINKPEEKRSVRSRGILDRFKESSEEKLRNRQRSVVYKFTEEEKKIRKESPKQYDTCLKYYYSDPKDFADVEDGGLNLSCRPRPWYSYRKDIIDVEEGSDGELREVVLTQNVKGRKAFSDATLYKPVDMDTYISGHFIKPFRENRKDGISPFEYQKSFIDKTTKELCNPKGFELKPHQKFCGQFINNHTDFPGMIVYHRLGSGKCMKKDTPVIMIDGTIKKVQDIKVGELLMGSDSKPRKVLSLGRGKDTMYEVVPVKGDSYTFNSEHVLSLKHSLKHSNEGVHYVNDKRCKNQKKFWCATWFNNETIKTESKYFETRLESEIYLKKYSEKSKLCNISIKDFLKLSKRMQNQLKLYRVSVEFPERDIPFDPYIIGFWIGDGSSSGTKITTQDSTVLLYLRNTLAKQNMYLQYQSKYDYRINSLLKNNNNKLMTVLRDLNLINNKHVPDLYKINSRKVRLELLAGLIDSDGHLGKNGCYEFTQKNETTMDGVLYLARSLGFAAYKSVKKTSWTYKGVKKTGTAFRTTISGDISEIPVKIKRKMATKRSQKKDVLVTGFKIVEKPRDNYYGFELDGDHLYLLGDFTVTHNTATSIVIAESMKATSIDHDGEMHDIPGRETSTAEGRPSIGCTITVAVPKATIEQYKEEISGKIINGEIISATGACVIYTEEEVDGKVVGGEGYRQFYVGKASRDIVDNEILRDSNGEIVYELSDYQNLADIEHEIHLIQKHRIKLDADLVDLREEILKTKSKKKIVRYKERQKEIVKQINKTKRTLTSENKKKIVAESKLNERIQQVYFIVSQDTLLIRLSSKNTNVSAKVEKRKDGTIIKPKALYNASAYLLGLEEWNPKKGAYFGTPPHSDCFHSQKSLLIIDEIQKKTAETGSYHAQLFHALYYNAREMRTGLPAMKVVLLTATPVYDNPHQMAMMVNAIRPRIPFPKDKFSFRKMFIQTGSDEQEHLKNKLLLSYMMSGYISYCAGGNPNGYPYRRNHTQMHVMETFQLGQYSDFLTIDVKNIMRDKGLSVDVIKYIDKVLKGASEKASGQFQKTRGAAICALPTPNVKITKKKGSSDADYQAVLKLTTDLKKDPESFSEYSTKLKWIGDKIIESSKTAEGPIFVYSSLIARGLLPLMAYLEAKGWEILNDRELSRETDELLEINRSRDLTRKRFAVWGGKSFEHYHRNRKKGTIPFIEGNEIDYRNNFKEHFNSPANKDGDICKVIFGKIEEGISFLRVSQVHLCDPWWNESKMEQIIGRGIRYCSHKDLSPKRQFVDVYYHCSILPTFPNIDENLLSKFPKVESKSKKTYSGDGDGDGNFKHYNKNKKFSKKQMDEEEDRLEEEKEFEEEGGPSFEELVGMPKQEQKYLNRGINFRDLARSSVEQYFFTTARKKNNLNNQFDMVAKESAVDCELNRYGNIVRLEECSFPDNKEFPWAIKKPKNTMILYNRSINKYYLYSLKSKQITEILMNYRDDTGITSWPAMSYKKTDIIIEPFKLSVEKDIYNRNMVSAIVLEDIKCFNKDSKTNNKTFVELRDHALRNGEDKFAWSLAETLRLNNEAMEMLIAAFGLESSRGTSELQNCLVNNFINGPIRDDLPKDIRKQEKKNRDDIEKSIMTEQGLERKRKLVNILMGTPKYKSWSRDKLNEHSLNQIEYMWKRLPKKK